MFQSPYGDNALRRVKEEPDDIVLLIAAFQSPYGDNALRRRKLAEIKTAAGEKFQSPYGDNALRSCSGRRKSPDDIPVVSVPLRG